MRLAAAAMVAVFLGARADDEPRFPITEYADCVKSYALKFSKSREPAGDIADAALAACMTIRADLQVGLMHPKGPTKLSLQDARAFVDRIAADQRRIAIQAIVEARFKP